LIISHAEAQRRKDVRELPFKLTSSQTNLTKVQSTTPIPLSHYVEF